MPITRTTDHPPAPRARRRTLATLAAATAALALSIGAASAAVPTFPDNLVVFPDRDFISAEGFQDHVGETALVTVTRPAVGVVGSARVVIGEGDVPFEINHPGGYCWGAGTDLDVTPDIQPGDVVALRFDDGSVADVRSQDAYVTAVDYAAGSDTFTVVGHIGAGVDPANIEQRIVNPELTDTAVGRRDVRAVPGPVVDGRGGAYASGLEVSGTTFTATYVFDDPAVARIAATGGGERLLSWQQTDAAANRQGITIAEFGELGGPGLGGCPNGPLSSGPRGPSGVTAVRVTSGGSAAIKVDWTPATAIPGTPAITGYRVTAVGATVTNGQQIELGRRITGQGATSATIAGIRGDEDYDVQITSTSSAGETFPAVHAIPVVDAVAPTVTAGPGGGTFGSPRQVTLTTNEPNSQIFFTTDGTDPLVGPDLLSDTALAYAGPITVDVSTTLRAVAFDAAGNASTVLEETYIIDAAGVVPSAPTVTAAEAGVGSATIRWTPDPADVVTDYTVTVTDQGGVARTDLPQNPLTTTARELTVEGLTEGTPYWFVVRARNVNGPGAPSTPAGPVTPLGAVVASAGADQTVTRGLAPTTVTLSGAGSTPGAAYAWTQVGASAADGVLLTGADTLSPTFALPLYRFPMTNGALTFRLTVTSNGTVRTDDVVVTVVRGDTIAVTQARWKAGDFRVDGTGSVNNAVVTVHSGSLAGPVLGTAQVTAGAWSLRLRNGAAPATRPATVWAESTLGHTIGPVTVN